MYTTPEMYTPKKGKLSTGWKTSGTIKVQPSAPPAVFVGREIEISRGKCARILLFAYVGVMVVRSNSNDETETAGLKRG